MKPNHPTENLTSKIQSGKPLLVFFFKPFCSSCNLCKPAMEEFQQKFSSFIEIIEYTIEANSIFARTLNLTTMPSTIFFHEGIEKWRHTGVIGAENIYEALEKVSNFH
jgi:thioredoxin-like negative regulator of GroEL